MLTNDEMCIIELCETRLWRFEIQELHSISIFGTSSLNDITWVSLAACFVTSGQSKVSQIRSLLTTVTVK